MSTCRAAIVSLAALALFGSAYASDPHMGTLTPAYVENKGQWDGSAQFLAQMPNLNMWVTPGGVTYDFNTRTQATKGTAQGARFEPTETAVKGHVIRMSFEGSNTGAPAGAGQLQGTFNYLGGRHRTGWVRGARRFGEVRTESLYDGVSARYYFDKGLPRFDLIVAPGADPNRILMKLEGADSVSITPTGALHLETSLGPVEQRDLQAYQGEGSLRKGVGCRMESSGNFVRFQVGDYDRTKPLVIDPLLFATYIGGNGGGGVGDRAAAVTANDAAIFVAGTAVSSNFPTTVGAYQTTMIGGEEVGFLASFGGDGSLNWATYIQGLNATPTSLLALTSVILDSQNNLLVAGEIENSALPTTVGAFQTAGDNSVLTGFILKISNSGTSLVAGTYLAGTGANGYVSSLARDQSGNVLATGRTGSTNFPTTLNAFQPAKNGAYNTFAAKLSADLSTLMMSTYLGGSASDIGYAVKADASGNAIVVGQTSSTDFPVKISAFQISNKSGNTAFVSTISADGTTLLESTFLGGTTYEAATGVTLDFYGDIYVAGYTSSSDFPTTAGVVQTALKGSTSGFASHLSPDGSTLVASTYVGGSGSDVLNGISFNGTNNSVYLVGDTTSANYPVSVGAYQTPTGSGSSAFLTQLTADMKTMYYSTVFGSNTVATAVANDASHNALVVGSAGTIPVTPSAFQKLNGAATGTNAFVAAISPFAELGGVLLLSTDVVGGSSVPAQITLSSVAPPGGRVVSLQSDKAAAQVQAMVTVPANTTKLTFSFPTALVNVKTLATIKSTFNGVIQSGVLEIDPFGIKKVDLFPSTIVGGQNATGKVTLMGPAAAGGMTVNLSSSDASLHVPATVIVPAAQTTATFPITTTPVSANTYPSVKASNDNQLFGSAVATVVPPSLSFFNLQSSVTGGITMTGELILNTNAPTGGTTVGVFTDYASAANPPANVVVPAGVHFVFFKIPTYGVFASTQVHLSAALGSVILHDTVTVNPAVLTSMTLTPASVHGGDTSIGRAYLSGFAPIGGDTVHLSSANTAIVQVPATAVVAQNTSYIGFVIHTSGVTASTGVSVTATFGAVTKHATLTVTPAVLASVVLSPTSVKGGGSSTGTVKLDGLAGAGGVVVALSSNLANAHVPASVMVPAGKLAVAFTITTTAVTTTKQATISASLGGTMKTAILTLTP